MQITVFGANGKVGSLIVQIGLNNGYKVIAFIHGTTNFSSNANLRIFQGNIYDAKQVAEAIHGSDVVISALGSWGNPKKDILTAGMHNIIPAMQKQNIKRIVSLTGADAKVKGEPGSMIGHISRSLLNLVAKKVLQDGEQHIDLLKNSELEWTVIRSPVMNDKGEAGRFTLNTKKPMPWATINRNSVAQCMVDLIKNNQFSRQSPFIKRA